VTGPDETERADAAGSVFFVQLLYRRGREARWVTAAVGDRRAVAVRRAADLYRNLAAPDGRLPQAVRVRSEAELVALEGEEGLERALADLNPGVLAAVARDGA
jgi:hypothetical protein